MLGAQREEQCDVGITEEASLEGGQEGLAEGLTFELNLKNERQPVVPSAGRDLFT